MCFSVMSPHTCDSVDTHLIYDADKIASDVHLSSRTEINP